MGILSNLFGNKTYSYESSGGDDWTWLNGNIDSKRFINPIKQYNTNFALQSIVNLRASYFSKGVFKVLDVNGNEIESHPLLEIFKSPNALMTKNEFLKQWVVLLSLYGYEYIYIDGTIGIKSIETVNSLVNTNPTLIENEITFKQLFNNTIEQNAKITFEDGSIQKVSISELISYYDTTSGLVRDNITKGTSRVEGCWESIVNVNKALDAKNILLGMPGGLGMITANPVNKQGQMVTMNPDDKKDLEDKLTNQRGLGSGKNAILTSTKPLKYESFVHRLKQFGYDDAINEDLNRVAISFNIPLDLLIKTGTYENQKEAEKRYIQGDIEQLSRNFCQPFTELYLQDGQELIMDYRHLEVFDTNPVNDVLKFSNSITQLLENEIITTEEARELFETIKKG